MLSAMIRLCRPFASIVWLLAAACSAGAQPVGLFPPPGARDVCPDTPLRLTFPSPPAVGTGRVVVTDVATGTVVAAVDVATRQATRTIGGVPGFNYYPVLIDGNQAIIQLPSPLGYGRAYAVNVEAGVLRVDSAAVELPGPWTFQTRPAAPAADLSRLVVAADGTGDFCTIQGALDSIPDGSRRPVTVWVRRGIYRELLVLAHRHAVTLLGEDRTGTILTYANNANFNPAGSPYRRGLFLAHRCEDLVIANLTLHNTTLQGGSQAEALILNGSLAARALLLDTDLRSFQDTLQVNGQAYVRDCRIEGDVDFLWGTGPAYFADCLLRSLRSNAYYTQVRNPAGNHGYVFRNCTFAGAPGVTGNVLSRIDPGRFPASEVVLLDCTLTAAIGRAAWRLDGTAQGASVRFWEYNSRDPDGQPVDVSGRLGVSRQLVRPADSATIDDYLRPANMLGHGWTPALAPLIAVQPSGVELRAGTTLTLQVTAVGEPAPAYRWLRDGREIAGATGALLALPAVTAADAGLYTAVASNRAGTVTSAAAKVVVRPDP
jgi:pectin methylesterase-like acyl-CoA thioesterase